MQHILSGQQFDRDFLEQLFLQAGSLRRRMTSRLPKKHVRDRFTDRLMFSVFYQASTRTRFSFDVGAVRLGMEVVSTENAQGFSSTNEEETLEDTIRILNEYQPDVIVLRHPEMDAAQRAAAISKAPIINARDGSEHPTKAMVDLYTIQQEKGHIDGLTIAVEGNPAKGRTARSLVYLLGNFSDVHLVFIAPPHLRINDDIKAYLARRKIKFSESETLLPALQNADVVHWTRTQREEYISKEEKMNPKKKNELVLDQGVLGHLKSDAIILHPGPRNNEIAREIDADSRAAYFRQAENGLYIRMALLAYVLEGFPS